MLSGNKIKEYVTIMLFILIFSIISIMPISVISFISTCITAALIGYLTITVPYLYLPSAFICMALVYYLFSGSFPLVLSGALPIMLCGLSLGIGCNLKTTPLKMIIVATGVQTLNITFHLKISQSVTSQNFIENVATAMEQMYQEILTTTPGATGEIRALVSQIISVLIKFSPAFIVILSFNFALLSYYFFKQICMLRKANCNALSAFSKWRADKSIGIIFFIMLALSFLLPANTLIVDAVYNVVTVMAYVFFILGLSVIEFLLLRRFQKSWSRKMILFIIAFVATMIAGIPFFIISVAGAMDSFLDYRKISSR